MISNIKVRESKYMIQLFWTPLWVSKASIGSQNFLNHYSWQFTVIIMTDTFSKAIRIEKWKLELLSKQFQVTWSLLNISKNWKTIQCSSDVMKNFAFSTEINLSSVALWFHLTMPGSWNFIRLFLDLPPRFSMVGC